MAGGRRRPLCSTMSKTDTCGQCTVRPLAGRPPHIADWNRTFRSSILPSHPPNFFFLSFSRSSSAFLRAFFHPLQRPRHGGSGPLTTPRRVRPPYATAEDAPPTFRPRYGGRTGEVTRQGGGPRHRVGAGMLTRNTRTFRSLLRLPSEARLGHLHVTVSEDTSRRTCRYH